MMKPLGNNQREGVEPVRLDVSAFWHGDPPSRYQLACLRSFKAAGYVVNLYTYEKYPNLPQWINWRDANQVIPNPKIMKHLGSFSRFSDIFRFELLNTIDTTWVDVDLILLSESLPETDFLFGKQSFSSVGTAILRYPSKSDLSAMLVANVKIKAEMDSTWSGTGPDVFTETIKKMGCSTIALGKKYVYPIHFSDMWMLFDPNSRDLVQNKIKGSYVLHLWFEFLRRQGPEFLDKKPPEGSYMSDFFNMYYQDAAWQGEIDPVWVRTVWRGELLRHKPALIPILFVARKARGVVRALRSLIRAKLPF
jgi:hypothetical protein